MYGSRKTDGGLGSQTNVSVRQKLTHGGGQNEKESIFIYKISNFYDKNLLVKAPSLVKHVYHNPNKLLAFVESYSMSDDGTITSLAS